MILENPPDVLGKNGLEGEIWWHCVCVWLGGLWGGGSRKASQRRHLISLGYKLPTRLLFSNAAAGDRGDRGPITWMSF